MEVHVRVEHKTAGSISFPAPVPRELPEGLRSYERQANELCELPVRAVFRRPGFAAGSGRLLTIHVP